MNQVNMTLRTYNEMAELYASKFNNLTLYDEAFSAFAARLPESARVLDVGCGPATSAMQLLQHKSDIKITGIDGAPNMIVKAKEILPNHEWQVMRFTEVANLKASFDGILASFCWPYLLPEQIDVFINHLSRLCAFKGNLLLSFVPGKENEEIIQTNPQGQSVYFRKDSLDNVEKKLHQANFLKINHFKFNFPRENGTEDHVFILAKKTI